MLPDRIHRAWAEVDTRALRENYMNLTALTGTADVCCVVKANAYGHGAIELSRLYVKLGAKSLAVSCIDEAIQLRDGGISVPILVLGYTPPSRTEELIKNNIVQAVFSFDYAEMLAECAAAVGGRVRAHVKLDTGMGRLGFLCRSKEHHELDSIVSAFSSGYLIPEGIFSHFASADGGEKDDGYTADQLDMFNFAVDYLSERGLTFETVHVANSAAVLDHRDSLMNTVRLGIALYGYMPSHSIRCKCELKQAISLKTVVAEVKTVYEGETVGYGRSFTAARQIKVATLPIGYADGIPRSAGGRISVEINGKPAPIIGNVCMDQCMADVSGIADVDIGTTVTVYGLNNYNSVDTVAELNGTIPYEIVCAIGTRIPRVYVNTEEV